MLLIYKEHLAKSLSGQTSLSDQDLNAGLMYTQSFSHLSGSQQPHRLSLVFLKLSVNTEVFRLT
jgi:hypothetical protein